MESSWGAPLSKRLKYYFQLCQLFAWTRKLLEGVGRRKKKYHWIKHLRRTENPNLKKKRSPVTPASEAGQDQERVRSHSACAFSSQGLSVGRKDLSDGSYNSLWCGMEVYSTMCCMYSVEVHCAVIFYCMCAVGLCGVLWYWTAWCLVGVFCSTWAFF